MAEKLLDFDINKLGENRVEEYKKVDKISKRDIAIIGMAGKFGSANNIHEFWNNISNDKDYIREIPKERKKDIEQYLCYIKQDEGEREYQQLAYLDEIDKFDYSFFGLSPKEASLMDPSQRLFLQTAWEAIEDAGQGGKSIVGSRTGVFVGLGSETLYRRLITEVEPSSLSMSVLGNVSSITASRIAYLLDLHGPCMLVDTACSSSLVAIYLACQEIRNKNCEMAIAGSVELNLLPLENKHKIGVESSDGRTKTFDDDSDGTGGGEGVAAILLKSLENAVNDGDHIYAVIKGCSINQDGSTNGIAAPNPVAQEDVITRAWEDANLDPNTISYIEAHGTGTKLGDPIEIEGITRAFRRYTSHNQFCAVGSVKSNLGHLNNAAGIAGLIKSVLALKNAEIPASIHFLKPNRNINFKKSPVYVNDVLQEWIPLGALRRCGVSSFGISGTNCHVVLEEFIDKRIKCGHEIEDSFIFTISAKNQKSLFELIKMYHDFIDKSEKVRLEDICYTASTGRGHYNYRLAIIINDKNELKEKLRYILNSCDRLDKIDPFKEKIYYGSHRLVRVKKKNEKGEEIYENEKLILSESANSIIARFKRDKKNNIEQYNELCKLYIKGGEVDWGKFYSRSQFYKVQLPVYPFEKLRCWIDVPETIRVHENNATGEDNIFYNMEWEPKQLERLSHSEKKTKNGSVLIFRDSKGISDGIESAYEKKGYKVITAKYDDCYRMLDEEHFSIGETQKDYDRLFQDIKESDITKVIHLMSIVKEDKVNSVEELDELLKRGIYSLFYIIRSITQYYTKKEVEINLISEYVNQVNGKETGIRPEGGALFGFGKVISIENPFLRCRCIDIDSYTNASDIIDELEYGMNKYQVAYRDGERFEEIFKEVNISSVKERNIQVHEGGVYLITGGLGRVGIEIAKYFASMNKVIIAMVNRTRMPDREEWDSILKSDKDINLQNKIKSIREIENMGSQVICYSADICVKENIERVLDDLRVKYGGIKGIVHSAGAGVGKIGTTLVDEEESVFKGDLAPKIHGTWILDNLVQSDNIDFFVMFSSAATIIGGSGMGAYVAGNSYIDIFAYYRKRRGLNALTVGWPSWKDSIIAKGKDLHEYEIKHMFKSILTNEAISAFHIVLKKELEIIKIGKLNYDSYVYYFIDQLPFELSNEIKARIGDTKNKLYFDNKDASKDNQIRIVIKGEENQNYTELERKIALIWCKLLGMKEINVDDHFLELGGNSIIAIRMEIEMEYYGLPFEVKDIYKYPTVRELAFYIDNKIAGVTNKSIARRDTDGYFRNHACKKELFNDANIEEKSDTAIASKKILKNIMPFNEILYKHCLYNSLFPVISHFHESIFAFLVNDIIAYGYSEKKKAEKFNLEYKSLKSDEEILKEIGIVADTKIRSNDIINDIVSGIRRNRPIVLWVDCYYESIRDDSYLKNHWGHTWLIYGYDEEKKICNIIEHMHHDNLSYEERIVSYQDVINCYNGFLNNFHKTSEAPSYYEFYRDKTELKRENTVNIHFYNYKQKFLSNIAENKELLDDSLSALEKFVDDFKCLTSNEDMMKEHIMKLMENLNNIVNTRKVEDYRFSSLFSDQHEINNLSKTIVKDWGFIRAKVAKSMYLSSYSHKAFKGIDEKIKLIYENECRYYKMILELLGKV